MKFVWGSSVLVENATWHELHELARIGSMSELLYKDEVFQLVGFCMEIHRELGRGHDEVIYKDALVVELSRAQIPFSREKNYEISYKGVVLPHFYYADLTPAWSVGQFRRWFAGMETNYSLNSCKFVKFV